MNLQYGEKLDLKNISDSYAFTIRTIESVTPIRYNAVEESWIVCEQGKATHMMIEIIDDLGRNRYMFIKIGECENIYLLADAIVD